MGGKRIILSEICLQHGGEHLEVLQIFAGHMIKVMCDKKEVLEKMKEGTCEKGELVSLRVKIQNMQYRLMKAEETSATLYENFATGLLDEQEYLALKEHYVQEKEKLTEPMIVGMG